VHIVYWNVSVLEDADSMYEGTSEFQGTGLRSWTTLAVANMDKMFHSDWDINIFVLWNGHQCMGYW
jgi:Mycoplasma protein of unknown function, DUF285